MKKNLILVLFIFAALFLNAQTKNNFIQKGKFVVYPRFSYSKVFNYWGLGAEFGYLPVNKLELKTGLVYYFGEYRISTFDLGIRYYLFKSKFTVFPEMNYYPTYNFIEKKYRQYFDVGLGAGYYGILKRIGIDFIVRYEINDYNHFYPCLRVKILLGKLDKEKHK